MNRADALLQLLRTLAEHDYRFTTVTPATHARVLARPAPAAPTLADVFGWNRPFRADQLPADVLDLLRRADALTDGDDGLRSGLRVASLGRNLFLHSAFPTEAGDAVFFGPDTYRFAAVAARQWPRSAASVVDMGAGSGAGGIVAARLAPSASITLVDSNGAALELAAVNAAAAGVAVTLRKDREIPPGADLVLANPPYMIDGRRRSYRDGGALLGGEVSRAWAAQAVERLVPGGTLLLYTGAAYIGGNSPLVAALEALVRDTGATLAIEELDPDVFGEELDQPGYENVERIAAIGAVLRTPV
jgi:methylase of polypeptide subunit release factors